MNLSVVVVTHNSALCIADCIDAIRQRLPDVDVVVVDNASSDETRSIVTAKGAQLIDLEENVGFGRACNLGAAAAGYEHLLFLNPDVRLEHADIREVEQMLSRRPFGLVGAAVSTENGPQPLRLADRHWLADYVDNTLGALRPRELGSRTRTASSAQRTWVSGAMMLADRKQFLEFGGFDPRFFLYYEDRDLSVRYREAGLPIRATQAILGAHAKGGSSASGDLRVAPMGWAFLGWLQYVYLHHGRRDAARCAGLAIRTLRGMHASLAIAARLGGADSRVVRKSEQLASLLAFLDRQARNGADKSFCPDARRLVGAKL
jgi:N-acetylglucosaminyl-diphospho-decaprenol L-rhamnosyltransferase